MTIPLDLLEDKSLNGTGIYFDLELHVLHCKMLNHLLLYLPLDPEICKLFIASKSTVTSNRFCMHCTQNWSVFHASKNLRNYLLKEEFDNRNLSFSTVPLFCHTNIQLWFNCMRLKPRFFSMLNLSQVQTWERNCG